MEFVLKHDKFAHLCDIESFPDSLRPLRLDTEAGKVKGHPIDSLNKLLHKRI